MPTATKLGLTATALSKAPAFLSAMMGLFVLTSPISAHGDSLNIELNPKDAPLPNYVCLLTDVSIGIKNLDATIREMPNDDSNSDSDEGKEQYQIFNWTLLKEQEDLNDLKESGKPLSAFNWDSYKNSEGNCRDSRQSVCAPDFEWKRKSSGSTKNGDSKVYLVCKANTNTEGETQINTLNTLMLVLHMEKDLHGGELQILDEITFRKNSIELHFKRNLANFSDRKIELIGGSYADRKYLYPVVPGQIVQLPLFSRCGKHEVQLMPMKTMIGKAPVKVEAEFREADQSVFKCAAEVDKRGRFDMFLPYRSDEKKSIAVTAGEKGDRNLAVYEAQWFENVPPKSFSTRMTKLSFAWRRHCLYPKGENRGKRPNRQAKDNCPAASLPKVGLDCKADFDHRTNSCRYICDVDKYGRNSALSARFEIPTDVVFTRPGTTDTWTETLNYVGQELFGYVAPEERQLIVDFSLWEADDLEKLTRTVGDRIDYIEVRSPKGDLHRLKFRNTGEQRVKVPWVRCDDVLAYRIVGRRTYKEDTLLVEDGRIKLPPPEETARKVGWVLMTGGGYNTAHHEKSEKDGSTFKGFGHGWIQLGFPLRPVGLKLGKVPIWFDLVGVHASITTKYYQSVVPQTDETDYYKKRKVLFARWILGSDLKLSLSDAVFFGLGLGYGLGHVVRAENRKEVGSVDLFFALWNDLTVQLTERLSLIFVLRLHIDEETRYWQTDYFGTPTKREETLFPTVFLEAGIRYEGL